MNNINYLDWMINEVGFPGQQPPDAAPGMGGPMDPSGPVPPQGGPAPESAPDPNVASQPQDPNFQPDDVSQDPQSPDMPEDDDHNNMHFEEWRNHFFKESIKGNTNVLIDLLNKVRDRQLPSPHRKFVEDNLQIQLLRQIANVMQASKGIRKKINEQLDRNNPATTIVNHINDTLQEQRLLVDTFIKLSGYLGMKGELHRKYLAALMGAVQVGSGANNEDIILNDHEYSVELSTRFARDFGRFDLGMWSLHANEPDRFLSEPESKRLQGGSPEEREVLRHRIVMESIVNRFTKRGFILTVVGDDGTVYNVGWDIATCLKSSYITGRLKLKTKTSENSEITIDHDGNIVPYQDFEIKYIKDTGETDEDGKKSKQEVDFIERKDGMLFLVSPLDLLKEAASTLQGLVVTEIPYQGNPSDLNVLTRCVYSTPELIMRQC